MKGELSDLPDMLKTYAGDVLDDFRAVSEEVGKEAAAKLKQATTGNNGAQWKHYPRTWTSTLEEHRLSVKAVVHNTKYYRLAHLLEHGHAVKNGYGYPKRGKSQVAGHEHIAPVDEWAQEAVQEKMEERIGR